MNHDDLRAKALAATPGPWRAEGGSFDAVIDAKEGDVADCLYSRDAQYIAAASPDVVLGLLDEIERLEGILAYSVLDNLSVTDGDDYTLPGFAVEQVRSALDRCWQPANPNREDPGT